jgi:ribose-phosphate diphosphokinase
MIKINSFNTEITQFPNGERGYEFTVSDVEHVRLFFKYEDDKDIFSLICAAETIYRWNKQAKIELIMPYIPYSRMDRVKKASSAFTLKSFANVVNNIVKPQHIKCLDAHSDVSLALFDCHVYNFKPQIRFINEKYDRDTTLIVYPDGNAAKKYKEYLSEFKSISLLKDRNFESGQIAASTITDSKDLEKLDLSKIKNVVIVDDLCSKGGTFLRASENIRALLKNDSVNIDLVVAHCEYNILNGQLLSKDSPFNGKFYTSDSIIGECFTEPRIVICKDFNLSS